MKIFKQFALLILTAATAAGCNGAGRERADFSSVRFPISDSILREHVVDTIALGNVYNGETVSLDFTLVNKGRTPMVILGIESGCGCIELDYDHRPVPVDGECKISLTYHATDLFAGWQQKHIYIATSLAPEKLKIVVTSFIR